MNKDIEKSLFPELRFPEFKNQNTWKSRKLSEILFEHRNKNTGKEEVFSVSVHKGIINQIEHLGRSYSGSNTNNYNLVLPGDLVYTKSPTGNFPYGIIKQSRQEKSVIVSPLYGVFTPETIDLGCILDAYFESQSNTFNYLAPIVQKGAKNTINIKNETFLSQSLNVPIDKKEQKKISDCLSSLDEVIKGQNQKIDFLKGHKIGLMQSLFPINGELSPKLRFKEFDKDGNWKEKRLEEICDVNPSSKKLPKQFVYIDLESVENGILLRKKIIPLDGAPSRAQRFLMDKDVIFQMVRPYQKNNYYYQTDDEFDYVASTGYAQLRAYESSNFLFQYLHTPTFVDKVLAKCTGSNYPAINSSDLKVIKVIVPKINEQQKIAECLSLLDNKIDAETKRLEILKNHKIGLIQQLFSNVI